MNLVMHLVGSGGDSWDDWELESPSLGLPAGADIRVGQYYPDLLSRTDRALPNPELLYWDWEIPAKAELVIPTDTELVLGSRPMWLTQDLVVGSRTSLGGVLCLRRELLIPDTATIYTQTDSDSQFAQQACVLLVGGTLLRPGTQLPIGTILSGSMTIPSGSALLGGTTLCGELRLQGGIILPGGSLVPAGAVFRYLKD